METLEYVKYAPIIDHILESIDNGQWRQAVEQAADRCRSKPVTFARRVGCIVGALCDRGRPDDAARFLNSLEHFNQDR